MGMIQLTLLAILAIWPFSSGKTFPMTGDPSLPAASGTVHAQRNKDNGNTKLDIKVNNLARPSSLTPPANDYVIWVRPGNGPAVREAAIGVDKNLNGEAHVVTVLKDFDVFITPEQSETVTMPSGREVLRAHISMD
jgi:hypothetical protein